MAIYSPVLAHVKERMKECLGETLVHDTCRRLGHKWRQRKLNPALSVQLLVLQLLAHVALTGLRHVGQVAASAQAICAARMRLPLQLFAELVKALVPIGTTTGYRGIPTYLVDGMGFTTPDKAKLERKYGKPKNQRGTSKGYPAPKLLALMEIGRGFIVRAILLPGWRHELPCLSRLFKSIAAGGLLMGDRALVSFTHMAMLLERGLHGCFRLPRWQVVHGRGKASRRLLKRLGKQDMLVRWTASRKPTWLSKVRWANYKDRVLTLRQISFRVCRPGFRTHWAWVITDLLDPEKYPAEELAQFYSERWQVEVEFRHLKRTLNMHQVSAQTVAGVKKEMLAAILLHNLVRQVMLEAGRRQGVAPDRISFKDAMIWLLYAPPGSALPKLVVNPQRRRDTQPRRLKNARRPFPQLQQSRAEARKPRCVVKI